MNTAEIRQAPAPVVRINWDALGAFFYNPHPAGSKFSFTEIGGIKYPYGTLGVIVTGKHYVIRPQGLGHVQADDPNFALVVQNMQILIGEFAKNDYGVRRIYLEEAEAEGPAYFEKLDARGANVICDTIRRTVVDALANENASRASRHIPPRGFDRNEEKAIAVLEALSERLDTQKAHDHKMELEAIRAAALELPDFAETLASIPIQKLKRRAKLAGMMVGPTTTKADLIRMIQEKKAIDLQNTDPGTDPDVLAAAATAPPTPSARTTGEDIPEPGDEEISAMMDETVHVDDGEFAEGRPGEPAESL